MEKWLSGEARLEGYEKFRFKLERLLRKDEVIYLPKGHYCRKSVDKGLLNIDNTDISEKAVCDLWNYIRDAGVLRVDEIPEEYNCFSDAFFEIMKKLEYISSVIVSSDGKEFASSPNAYQYIAD